MFRFFFNGNSLSVGVEFYDAETLRIVYIIAEYGSALAAFRIFHSGFQSFLQTVACKDIVTQHHGYTVIPDKVRADDKGLGQSVGTWLHFIGEMNAKLMAIPQKSLKPGSILRCGNDQDIPDPCVHEN